MDARSVPVGARIFVISAEMDMEMEMVVQQDGRCRKLAADPLHPNWREILQDEHSRQVSTVDGDSDLGPIGVLPTQRTCHAVPCASFNAPKEIVRDCPNRD